MSAAHDVQALLDRIGAPSKLRLARSFLGGASGASAHAREAEAPPRPLLLAWPGLDEVLPDGGLPRGVIELSAPHALGGSTSFALAAVRAGQARGREAWCAWVDPEASLHAPGVVRAGVDVTRLLVVCPERESIGRTAVKVVASGAFEVVVIDVDAIGTVGRNVGYPVRRASPTRTGKALAPEVIVRKLALAAEPSGATVLLLTDSTRPRSVAWPVSMRLELGRPNRFELSVRVAKERRGRIGLSATIPFRPCVAG